MTNETLSTRLRAWSMLGSVRGAMADDLCEAARLIDTIGTVVHDEFQARDRRQMLMLGADCTYTGEGDGPYFVKSMSKGTLSVFERTKDCSTGECRCSSWPPDEARAVCWFMNERVRLIRQPSPTADWLPGGERSAEVEADEAQAAEEARKEVQP